MMVSLMSRMVSPFRKGVPAMMSARHLHYSILSSTIKEENHYGP